MSTSPSAITNASAAWATVKAVRDGRPLIHNITNLVVTNFTANVLLAFGASPAMVEHVTESPELARISGALVINLGTMSPERAEGMMAAASAARDAGTPWVLDPVAAGVLTFRTEVAKELLQWQPTAIRGNASEIASLAGESGGGKGVDSTLAGESALDAAKRLATTTGAVVGMTGAVDYITDGDQVIEVHNGHPMMTLVTGVGCAATAVVGACLAVTEPLPAVAHGLALIGLAGDLAAERVEHPGSYQIALIDALHELSENVVTERVVIR